MPAINEYENNMKNKGESKNTKKRNKPKFKLFNNKKTVHTDDVVVELQNSYDKLNPKEINRFKDLPLSFKTQKGLKENDYFEPTEIQKESIGSALKGCDILGAAKTGSGKTLAFLIPVLEKLYCKKWTRLDGTGALIITPTRELAYQIFETLRKVGFYHDFSAGLIIGGKDLKFESKRMDQCNIVICTPGRLLHHMDENPLFDCVNLQILVLDEADRCLDMGFEETMNSIIANLPPNRQTLLFSATQTKSVRDLARLSLVSPKYISVHEDSSYSTPEGLNQSYIVCELEDKFSMLWSFIKTHYKHKIIVFLSSCKQVKYTYEIFCQLRPSVALLALYGSLHQQRRMDIYRSFCNKEHAVLFATDIAARGLDFPAVNWVIQMDCPEDATTYIHRVGRTARYHKGGEALLVLLPSEEEAMLANLREKKIPINEIKVNPKRLQNPRVKIEGLLARKLELKESAQRAFVAYVKSVFLMKDKKVFDVHKLNTDAFARSLGLVVSPRIRFLQRLEKSQVKKEKDNKIKSSNTVENRTELKSFVKSEPESSNDETDTNVTSRVKVKKENRNLENNEQSSPKLNKVKIKSESESDESNDSSDEDDSKTDEINKVSVNSELPGHSSTQSRTFQTFNFDIDDSGSEEDILKIKRKNHTLDDDDEVDDLMPLNEPGKRQKKPLTKAAIVKRILKKNIVPNKKITFTEEGQAVEDRFKQRITELGKKYDEIDVGGGIDIEEAQRVLREEDKIDKQLFKDRIKLKHREERIKLKKLRKEEEDDEDSSKEIVEDNEDYDYTSDNDNEDGHSSACSEDSDDDNNDNDDDDEEEEESDDDDEEEEEEDKDNESSLSEDSSTYRNLPKKKKRKLDSANEDNKDIRNKISRTTLSQAEELALKLLRK